MRTIKITSADGIEYTIEHHRTADRCWHLTVDSRIAQGYFGRFNNRPLYDIIEWDDATGLAQIESTSLERLMSFIAQVIGETEF